MQDSVDAITNAQIVLQRLDVNIRRAFFQRRTHDLVHETHHRRLGIFLIEDVDLLLQIERSIIDIATFQNRLERFRADAIAGTKRRQNRAPSRHAPRNGLLDFLPDHLPGGEVERIVGQQVEIVIVEPYRINLIAQSEPCGELLAQLVIHRGQRFLPKGKAVFGAHFAQEFVLRDEALFQQCANGRGLLRKRRIDRLLDRGLVAEARLQGQVFKHTRGHVWTIRL